MLKKTGVLMVLGFFLACHSFKKPKKPDNLIPKDQMEDLLYDLFVINAAKGVNKKILETNGFVPDSYVLNKHQVDSVRFADSNTYYAFSPEGYKEIIENVKARLEKEKETYDTILKEEDKKEKSKRDSITVSNRKKKDSISGGTKSKSN